MYPRNYIVYYVYVTCFFRFLHLCYLKSNKKKERQFPVWIICSIILSFIYLTFLKRCDLSPFVLDYGWSGEQWPSFFWTYFIFILLRQLGLRLSKTRISKHIVFLGKNSWYVFLAQMFFLSYFNIDHLSFIENDILRAFCYVAVVFVLSITPEEIFKRRKRRKRINEESLYNPS